MLFKPQSEMSCQRFRFGTWRRKNNCCGTPMRKLHMPILHMALSPGCWPLPLKPATALHSWGAALRPCPCKCRTQAFSKTSLLSRGLRGVDVPSQVLESTRFPHPAEAGLLNSLPPAYKHLPDARAALCLVGQLAAPLQALWIAGQIQGWAAKIFKTEPCDPLLEWQAFKAKLCAQRSDLWQLRSHLGGGDIRIRDQDSTQSVNCTGPVLACHLLQRLRPFRQGFTGLRKVGNRILPPVLHFQPEGPEYELCLQRIRAAKPDDLQAQTARSDARSLAVDTAQAAGFATVVDAHGQCSDVQLCGLANALAQVGKPTVQVVPPKAAMALLEFVNRASKSLPASGQHRLPPQGLFRSCMRVIGVC